MRRTVVAMALAGALASGCSPPSTIPAVPTDPPSSARPGRRNAGTARMLSTASVGDLARELQKIIDRSPGVWLQSYALLGASFEIAGFALSKKELASFVGRLEKSPASRQAELLFSETIRMEGRDVYTFSVRAKVDPSRLPRPPLSGAEGGHPAGGIFVTRKEIPQILKDISTAGRETGVKFHSLRPSAEEKKKHHARTPVFLGMRGSWDEFTAFFAKLDGDRLSVDRLKMEKKEERDGVTLLLTTADLSIYRLLQVGVSGSSVKESLPSR